MNGRAILDKWRKKKPLNRWIAFAVCIFFIASSLFSLAFVFAHTNHIHDHDAPDGGCATCVQLSGAEKYIKILSMVFVKAVFFFGCFSSARLIWKPSFKNTGFLTLVSLHIRLND